jgi:hypothetical protein
LWIEVDHGGMEAGKRSGGSEMDGERRIAGSERHAATLEFLVNRAGDTVPIIDDRWRRDQFSTLTTLRPSACSSNWT